MARDRGTACRGWRWCRPALIDHDEFAGEQDPGDKAGAKRAVALENRNAAQPAPAGDQQRRNDRADRGLHQRRDVVDGELGGDLVEAHDRQSTSMIAAAAASSGRVTLLEAATMPSVVRSRRLAMRADAGDLDHRRFRREAGGARSGLDGVGDRGRGRLADGAALLADQEHHRIAAVVILYAGDEGVAAFDAVGEPLLAQEIERAIDGDRRRPRTAFAPAGRSTHRRRAAGGSPAAPPARGGGSASGARRVPRTALGMRDGVVGAALVVVIRRREHRVTMDLFGQGTVRLHGFKCSAITVESRKMAGCILIYCTATKIRAGSGSLPLPQNRPFGGRIERGLPC